MKQRKSAKSQASSRPPEVDIHQDAVLDAEIIVPTICAVCGQGEHEDMVLVCDRAGCANEIHMYCLRPPIETIPEGDWYCPMCNDKNGSNEALTKSMESTNHISIQQNYSYKENISICQQQYYSFDDWMTNVKLSVVESEFSDIASEKRLGKVVSVYSSVDSTYHYGRIIAFAVDDQRQLDKYLVQFNSGKDNRSRGVVSWIYLDECACILHGELVWAKLSGYPWWPGQLIYRSGIELIKSGVVRKGDPANASSTQLVQFFYEDSYSSLSREEMKQFISPFATTKRYLKSCQSKGVNMAAVLAQIEYEEQQYVIRAHQHMDTSTFETHGIPGELMSLSLLSLKSLATNMKQIMECNPYHYNDSARDERDKDKDKDAESPSKTNSCRTLLDNALEKEKKHKGNKRQTKKSDDNPKVASDTSAIETSTHAVAGIEANSRTGNYADVCIEILSEACAGSSNRLLLDQLKQAIEGRFIAGIDVFSVLGESLLFNKSTHPIDLVLPVVGLSANVVEELPSAVDVGATVTSIPTIALIDDSNIEVVVDVPWDNCGETTIIEDSCSTDRVQLNHDSLPNTNNNENEMDDAHKVQVEPNLAIKTEHSGDSTTHNRFNSEPAQDRVPQDRVPQLTLIATRDEPSSTTLSSANVPIQVVKRFSFQDHIRILYDSEMEKIAAQEYERKQQTLRKRAQTMAENREKKRMRAEAAKFRDFNLTRSLVSSLGTCGGKDAKDGLSSDDDDDHEDDDGDDDDNDEVVGIYNSLDLGQFGARRSRRVLVQQSASKSVSSELKPAASDDNNKCLRDADSVLLLNQIHKSSWVGTVVSVGLGPGRNSIRQLGRAISVERGGLVTVRTLSGLKKSRAQFLHIIPKDSSDFDHFEDAEDDMLAAEEEKSNEIEENDMDDNDDSNLNTPKKHTIEMRIPLNRPSQAVPVGISNNAAGYSDNPAIAPFSTRRESVNDDNDDNEDDNNGLEWDDFDAMASACHQYFDDSVLKSMDSSDFLFSYDGDEDELTELQASSSPNENDNLQSASFHLAAQESKDFGKKISSDSPYSKDGKLIGHRYSSNINRRYAESNQYSSRGRGRGLFRGNGTGRGFGATGGRGQIYRRRQDKSSRSYIDDDQSRIGKGESKTPRIAERGDSSHHALSLDAPMKYITIITDDGEEIRVLDARSNDNHDQVSTANHLKMEAQVAHNKDTYDHRIASQTLASSFVRPTDPRNRMIAGRHGSKLHSQHDRSYGVKGAPIHPKKEESLGTMRVNSENIQSRQWNKQQQHQPQQQQQQQDAFPLLQVTETTIPLPALAPALNLPKKDAAISYAGEPSLYANRREVISRDSSYVVEPSFSHDLNAAIDLNFPQLNPSGQTSKLPINDGSTIDIGSSKQYSKLSWQDDENNAGMAPYYASNEHVVHLPVAVSVEFPVESRVSEHIHSYSEDSKYQQPSRLLSWRIAAAPQQDEYEIDAGHEFIPRRRVDSFERQQHSPMLTEPSSFLAERVSYNSGPQQFLAPSLLPVIYDNVDSIGYPGAAWPDVIPRNELVYSPDIRNMSMLQQDESESGDTMTNPMNHGEAAVEPMEAESRIVANSSDDVEDGEICEIETETVSSPLFINDACDHRPPHTDALTWDPPLQESLTARQYYDLERPDECDRFSHQDLPPELSSIAPAAHIIAPGLSSVGARIDGRQLPISTNGRDGNATKGNHSKSSICRYFVIGMCKYGDQCRYYHPGAAAGVPLSEDPLTLARPAVAQALLPKSNSNQLQIKQDFEVEAKHVRMVRVKETGMRMMPQNMQHHEGIRNEVNHREMVFIEGRGGREQIHNVQSIADDRRQEYAAEVYRESSYQVEEPTFTSFHIRHHGSNNNNYHVDRQLLEGQTPRPVRGKEFGHDHIDARIVPQLFEMPLSPADEMLKMRRPHYHSPLQSRHEELEEFRSYHMNPQIPPMFQQQQHLQQQLQQQQRHRNEDEFIHEYPEKREFGGFSSIPSAHVPQFAREQYDQFGEDRIVRQHASDDNRWPRSNDRRMVPEYDRRGVHIPNADMTYHGDRQHDNVVSHRLNVDQRGHASPHSLIYEDNHANLHSRSHQEFHEPLQSSNHQDYYDVADDNRIHGFVPLHRPAEHHPLQRPQIEARNHDHYQYQHQSVNRNQWR